MFFFYKILKINIFNIYLFLFLKYISEKLFALLVIFLGAISPPAFNNASKNKPQKHIFAEKDDLDSPCPVFAVRNKLLLKNTAAFPALDTPAAQNNISRNEHSVTAAYAAKKASLFLLRNTPYPFQI